MDNSKNANGAACELVFTRFITLKNGKRIYPKHGKVFCFPAKY